MAFLAGFGPLLAKELKELARERRLVSILAFLGLAMGLPYSFFVSSVTGAGGWDPGHGEAFFPVVYIGPLVLLIVSLTFAADTVSKEKDSGMLGLVMTSPVSPGGLLLAKATAVLVAYVFVGLFLGIFFLVITPVFGAVALEIILWIVLIPFLALFVFLLGANLLASVSLSQTKTSMGVSFAILFPVFLLMQEPPGLGFLVEPYAPRVYQFLAYNPFGVAIRTAEDVVAGRAFEWTPVLVSVGLGLLCLVIAYLRLRRQEVTA